MEALEFNEAQAQRDVSALQAGDRLTRKEAGAIAREELGFEAPVYELGVKGLDVLRKKSVLDMLKQKDIKLVVESGSDTGYQSQGNILLYTNTAIKQRKKIKGSIKMRKEIISWWHLLEFEEKGGVDRTDFAHLYTEVAAMLEVEYTSQDVARDWAEESKGKSHLGFSDFLESVFELVDLWVDSVDVHEYLIFMDNVLQHDESRSPSTSPPKEKKGKKKKKNLIEGINVEIPVTPWEIASHEHRDQVEAMVAAEGGDGKEAAATSAARGSGNKESAAAEEGKAQPDTRTADEKAADPTAVFVRQQQFRRLNQ
eukprot:gene6978-8320_t